MEQQIKAPPEIKKVAQFLRGGSAGVKVRVGALNGKRLDYFKGKQPSIHTHRPLRSAFHPPDQLTHPRKPLQVVPP